MGFPNQTGSALDSLDGELQPLRFKPRHKPHPQASPSDARRAPKLRKDSGQSGRGRLRHVYCGRQYAGKFRTGWKTEEQRGAIGDWEFEAID